jgi:hypothetical protein
MNGMQAQAIARIKDANGGELPSDLYLRTNEDLGKLLYDLTGKQPSRTASKTSLVQRIEKHNAKVSGTKRKADEFSGKENGGTTAKAGRAVSAGQLAESRRILASSAESLESRTTHSELLKMWERIGMKAKYPHRSSKASVIDRLRKYAMKVEC